MYIITLKIKWIIKVQIYDLTGAENECYTDLASPGYADKIYFFESFLNIGCFSEFEPVLL